MLRLIVLCSVVVMNVAQVVNPQLTGLGGGLGGNLVDPGFGLGGIGGGIGGGIVDPGFGRPIPRNQCRLIRCPPGYRCVQGAFGGARCVLIFGPGGGFQKPGVCPRPRFLPDRFCQITCNSDFQCPGRQKCCVTQCGGQRCVRPDFIGGGGIGGGGFPNGGGIGGGRFPGGGGGGRFPGGGGGQFPRLRSDPTYNVVLEL